MDAGLRSTLADLVEARLQDIANATHYRGEIPETPPTVSATDLRVLAYTVLWTGSGGPGDEEALGGGRQDDVDWTFTVTCAAGLATLVDPLIDLVLAQLDGWEPVLEGRSTGTCALDFDPGRVLPDPARTPTRYYLQLPFRLRAGS
jgi:hypothetical protein